MALHLLHVLYVSVGGHFVLISGTFGPVSRFLWLFWPIFKPFLRRNRFFGRFPNFGLSRNHTDLSQRAVVVVSGQSYSLIFLALCLKFTSP